MLNERLVERRVVEKKVNFISKLIQFTNKCKKTKPYLVEINCVSKRGSE